MAMPSTIKRVLALLLVSTMSLDPLAASAAGFQSISAFPSQRNTPNRTLQSVFNAQALQERQVEAFDRGDISVASSIRHKQGDASRVELQRGRLLTSAEHEKMKVASTERCLKMGVPWLQ